MHNEMILRHAMASAATLLAISPLAATAQEATSEIRLDVTGRYDTNVARSSAAQAASRGLERADTTISPTINVRIVRPFGPHSASLDGSVGYQFHARNTELNRERVGLNGALDMAVGPCRVAPHASIRRAQSDLGDIALSSTLPATVRNTETVVGFGSGLSCGDAYGLRPVAGIDYSRGTNSNPLRDRSEFEEWRYTSGLEYSSPGLGSVTLFASRRDVDLIQQPLTTGVDGYRITEYGLRYKRDVGTRFQVQGTAARSRLNSRNLLITGVRGFVWDTRLTGQFGERLRATLGAGRNISNSLASDSAFVVSKPYTLDLEYALNDRLRLNSRLGYTERDYRYAATPLVDHIDHETRKSFDVGATLRTGQRLQMRLGGGYERRNANGTTFDYGATFVTASIGMRF
ncbi:MAG: outer membrane beta-barrel protein [Sphingopyxis sp.]